MKRTPSSAKPLTRAAMRWRLYGWLILLGIAMMGLLYMMLQSLHNTSHGTPESAHTNSALPDGLSLSALQKRTRTLQRGEHTQEQLLVSGTLKNTLQHPQVLPPLRLVLQNQAGIELDFWPVQWAINPLPAGETLAFGATFLNPPQGNDIAITPQFGARVN